MMILKDVLTDSEVQSITNLVKAHLIREAARARLHEAQETFKQAARYLSEDYFRHEGTEYVSALPEKLVINLDGEAYLVTIDLSGDNGHTVELIGGVI